MVVFNLAAFHLLPVVYIFILTLCSCNSCHLLVSDILLKCKLLFPFEIFVVSPFCKYFHGLNILDGGHFFAVIFVSTENVKMNFFAETSILLLHSLQYNFDLFTPKNLFVIHTCDRMENCPHDFGIVDSTHVIANV